MSARRILIKMVIFIILFIPILSGNCFAAQKEVNFTTEEIIFIEEHPVIHLGVDPEFIPYEFIDKDGIYKGIAADYLQLLSNRTGLKFEVEKGLTLTDAYEKAVLKELDALPCISKTAEREQYFLFSNPYYSFQRVIFINENNSEIKSFSDLTERKVAVQKNSSHHSYLKGFSGIELSLYKSVEEAMQAVSEGRENVFVGNLATSSYMIKSNGITNLKYIPIETEEKQYLYFAVRNDWPILVDIINKGLMDITEEEKITIDNRWIGVQNKIDYGEVFKIAGIIGSIVLLVLIVSFYWVVKLRREIEKRKQIEADLKIAKEEAELANHIKSTFLARMSHEIRTPLNAITGISYLLKKTGLTTTQKIYLEKITIASRDMLGIINDILDFSKIEAGKVEIERISFNLDEVLEQIISIVSFKIEEQKIEFSMNKDAEIPTCFWGDPKRIEQVLMNIVNNALKFTKDGAVSVSIRLVAKVKDTYTIEFSIKDTGIGMSSEQMEQLFIPFNQADSSISRRFGGTGLGLSIVKSLVDMMGGTIKVYSETGEGSTFNVQISLDADRNKEYEKRKKNASVYFQNIRVLVVEKSFFYTNLLRNYLNSFSVIAEFAQSEDRAIQLMEDACKENGKPYNLLIVDHETPLEGGISFCNSLKNIPGIKVIPKSILLIPLSQEELFDKLEAAGLDFGITKPIIPSILYNLIVEIFKTNVLEIHDSTALVKNAEQPVTEFHHQILIIEDNKTNQFIARSILEQAGFTITLADNGKEGFEFFSKHSSEIHLILMDLHMPVMDGFEATRLIRGIDTKIPIIAMTADAITGVEKKCTDMGIDHYISKPFDPEMFVETVRQVLKSQDSAVTLSGEESEVQASIMSNEPNNGDESLAAVAVLDVVEGIKYVGGSVELYRKVIKEYYDENKDVAELLSKTIEGGDYKEAFQIVHKIKSSTGSIGAKELHKVATRLQKALNVEELEEITELYKVFAGLVNKVLQDILAELNNK